MARVTRMGAVAAGIRIKRDAADYTLSLERDSYCPIPRKGVLLRRYAVSAEGFNSEVRFPRGYRRFKL